jgi:hypothetical protein
MDKIDLKDFDDGLQAAAYFCKKLRRKIKKIRDKATDDDLDFLGTKFYQAGGCLLKIDAYIDEILIAARNK